MDAFARANRRAPVARDRYRAAARRTGLRARLRQRSRVFEAGVLLLALFFVFQATPRVSAAIGAAFEGIGKTGRMPPALGRWLGDLQAQRIVPFKAFDDAYFVGVCWVSAWLLPTPQGHFLI